MMKHHKEKRERKRNRKNNVCIDSVLSILKLKYLFHNSFFLLNYDLLQNV